MRRLRPSRPAPRRPQQPDPGGPPRHARSRRRRPCCGASHRATPVRPQVPADPWPALTLLVCVSHDPNAPRAALRVQRWARPRTRHSRRPSPPPHTPPCGSARDVALCSIPWPWPTWLPLCLLFLPDHVPRPGLGSPGHCPQTQIQSHHFQALQTPVRVPHGPHSNFLLSYGGNRGPSIRPPPPAAATAAPRVWRGALSRPPRHPTVCKTLLPSPTRSAPPPLPNGCRIAES